MNFIKYCKKYVRYIRIMKALKYKRTKELDSLILRDKYIFSKERQNGKTAAIMIWILVNDLKEPQKFFNLDKDFRLKEFRRCKMYCQQYLKLRQMCIDKGIKFKHNVNMSEMLKSL